MRRLRAARASDGVGSLARRRLGGGRHCAVRAEERCHWGSKFASERKPGVSFDLDELGVLDDLAPASARGVGRSLSFGSRPSRRKPLRPRRDDTSAAREAGATAGASILAGGGPSEGEYAGGEKDAVVLTAPRPP